MKHKHTIIVYLFVFITSILFALLLAGIEYLTGFGSSFLLMLIAVYIGNYLLRNLEFYTTTHKIVAALIAFFVFWLNLYAVTFLTILIEFDATLGQAIIYTFSIDGLLNILGRLQFFDYLIMIVMPIITYQYLNRKSAF